MKSCLICDDHALVREALHGTVSMHWPQAVIDQAGDFPSAWSKLKSHPELCIADLSMPGAEPLEGIKGIMRASPATKILIVTGTHDDKLLMELLNSGVAGFAPKSVSGTIIEAAIRLILAGGRYLPSRLADIAASRLSAPLPPAQPPSPVQINTAHAATAEVNAGALTLRQIDVLRLVAAGHSNKEIARMLGLSPSTVKTHLEHLLSALNVANRTEASVKAFDLRLL